MANRPCRPDTDLQRLWRTLLPGTPVPACGTAKDAAAATAPATDAPLKPPRDEQS
jgi:hypothetical protein